MKAHGLARLGKDAELRFTSTGEAVATLSLAFSYGRKGEDGKRPTQWVKGSLWGKRAEALEPYLLKGGLISVDLSEVHIETFEGQNGPGYNLVGKVDEIELAGGNDRQQGQQESRQAPQQQRPAPRQAAPRQEAPAPRQAAPRPASGFDDFDSSDIPF